MIGRTNAGGSGAAWTNAIIHVYAPSGSVITATKGSVTKIASEKVIIGRASEYFFYIKPADFGTWTISGSQTTWGTISKTVTVSSNVEYIMRLDTKIPWTYQEVEFLQSSGTQYINTARQILAGYEIEIKAALTSVSGNKWMFGQQVPQGGIALVDQRIVWLLQSASGETNYYPSTSLHSYKFVFQENGTSKIYYENDQLGSDSFDISDTRYYPFFLFYSHGGALSRGPASMKIYSVTEKHNSTIDYELIPCYRRSDSVAGMYDTGNGAFLTNAGTGTFTVGGDIT